MNAMDTLLITFVSVLVIKNVGANDWIFDSGVSLIDMDKVIVNGIQEPVEGKGDALLRLAFDYHDALESIARMLELEYRPERNIQLIREIKAAGGPQWAKLKVDINELNKIYKWDRQDKVKFKSVFGAVKLMWYSLLHHLSKVDAATAIPSSGSV